jgi:hypothetical protein
VNRFSISPNDPLVAMQIAPQADRLATPMISFAGVHKGSVRVPDRRRCSMAQAL